MDSAHSHIINAIHIGTKEFRCLSGLFRYRYICRPCRTYRDLPDSLLSLFFNLDNMGNFIILNLGEFLFQQFILMLGGPCPQDFSLFLIEPPENLQQVGIRFPAAENHLRKPGTQLSVGIQFGIAHFLKRLSFQIALRLLQRHLPVFKLQ